MTIERIITQVFTSGVYLERHHKAILILIESCKCSKKDLAAIARLQAAVDRDEIKNLCFTDRTSSLYSYR